MMTFASLVFDPKSMMAWLVVGTIFGWLISRVMQAPSYGPIGDVFLGGIGGLVGGFVFASFVAIDAGILGGAVAALIGAGVLIMGARLLTAERGT